MGLVKTHLLLYNVAQAVGWSLCTYQLLRALSIDAKDYRRTYDTAAPSARAFQAASILDVVHAALGWVPSNPAMAFVQWAGRGNVLFLVLGAIDEVQATLPAVVMLLVWSLAEVIRYPWYALTSLKTCPVWLTWLRYTAFILLYPVGVVAEMLVLYYALPFIKERRLYSYDMPNAVNMGFDYYAFIKYGLWIYIPIWQNLYVSLLRQRSRKLGHKQDDKQKTA